MWIDDVPILYQAPDGTIPAGMQRRLLAMGAWLRINGEAIYGTRPWQVYGEHSGEILDEDGVDYTNHSMRIHETEYRYTAKQGVIYAIAFQDTEAVILNSFAGFKGTIRSVSRLSSDSPVQWKMTPKGLNLITEPNVKFKHATVFRIAHDE
jgi:alpha-L-fucosidase